MLSPQIPVSFSLKVPFASKIPIRFYTEDVILQDNSSGYPVTVETEVVLMLILNLLFLCLLPLQTLDPTFQPPTQRAQSQDVDRVVRSFVGKNLFNGNVLVARKGKVLFRKSYGMA